MKYYVLPYYLFFSVLGYLNLCAQTDIPVLSWRSHSSYLNIVDITSSQEKLYVAAENALFYVDLDELSINKIGRNDGLNDVSIGAIEYYSDDELLLIGYTNGNIDLLYDNRILNIPVVKESQLVGSKRFNDIKINSGIAYLANDQGIFVIDLSREEIIESYRNLGGQGGQLTISQLAFSPDSIYATTPTGIISASLSPQVNRQDFNNWQRSLEGRVFTEIINTGTELYASSENELYRFENDQWVLQNPVLNNDIKDLSARNGTLSILAGNNVFTFAQNSFIQVATINSELQPTILSENISGYWLGTTNAGLLSLSNNSTQNFSPKGPASDIVWDITLHNETLYSLAGGHSTLIEPLDRNGDLSEFREGTWNINTTQATDLTSLVSLENSLFDSDLFSASFRDGIVNLSPSRTLIDDNTQGSTLQRQNGSLNITALAVEGSSIWVANYGFDNSIHKWNLETNTWEAFSFGFDQAKYPTDILVLPNGDKWVSLDANRGGGVLVFNETSGQNRYLTTSGGQGGLPGRDVTSMVLDDNNFLWVGTNTGIAFFPNPTTILEGRSVSASIPIFENGFLLRNEFISAIAVDPGNRKWVGTASNGIWLFSETGEELVYHFTEENSPLLTNEISDIEVNPVNGEVFIGTSKGLVSFRSDATSGQDSHSNVKAFPNPVNRDFDGVVTISGLVDSALVKITDSSGKLIREIRAQGSTAIWDATDYNGRRVQTGVYLVFSSSADGTETYVSKIAII